VQPRTMAANAGPRSQLPQSYGVIVTDVPSPKSHLSLTIAGAPPRVYRPTA